MHKFKSRSAKNVIGLKLSGTLSRSEYHEIVPYLEEKIKKYGKIRLLIELDHWEGWGAYAAFNDMFFVIKHNFQIERVAFLLKSEADKRAVLLARPFTPWSRDNTRYFGPEEAEAAWQWIGQGVLTPSEEASSNDDFDLDDKKPKTKKIHYGPKQSILIIGGGVSGLALAALLQQRGFEPTIVEARSEAPDNDRTLQIWPTAAGVLKSLRLYKKVLKASAVISSFDVYNSNGEFLQQYDNASLEAEYGPVLLVPRAKFIKIISKLISPKLLRKGVAATKLKEAEDAVKVTFSDGTKGVYDSVICADGINSKMRDLVLGAQPVQFADMLSWHFSVKADFEFPDGVRGYRGENSHIRLSKIGDKIYGFACIKTKDSKIDGNRIDLLKASFANYTPIVKKVVNLVQDTDAVWNEGFHQLQSDVCVQGRIAFLGEAAYGFLPTTMLSDSIALESAVILANQLSCSDSKLVSKAFKAYERNRLYRILGIQEHCKRKELQPFFQADSLAKVTDFSKGLISEEAYQSFWKWFLEEGF